MKVLLFCVAGPFAGEEVELDEAGLVIGRDPASAALILESPAVSRSHMRVSATADGRVLIEDLNSSNGVFLLQNGGQRRVSGTTVLGNGERFCVGAGNEYVFEARCPAANPGEQKTAAYAPENERTVAGPRAAANSINIPAPNFDSQAINSGMQKIGVQVNIPAAITEDMLAPRFSRFLAVALDSIIMLLCIVVVFSIMGVALGSSLILFIASFFIPFIGFFIRMVTGAIYFTAWFTAYAVYVAINGYFLYTSGQTIGKKVMGVYISGMDTKKAPIINIVLLRMIGMQVIKALPFVGGIIGLLDICFIARQDRRTLHDLLAGTVVLNVKK